jgi:NAD(P)-dependent dehydrogenase (short-subunit alcohol dehydrogenase family)
MGREPRIPVLTERNIPGFANIEGKVAIVTGGASGIGRGMAEELIQRGAQVIIADIEEAALCDAAAEIGAIGIRTDVSDRVSMQGLRDAVIGRFGTLHILCNNAGVAPVGKISDMTVNDWTWILGVNLWGCIHGVELFLPIMLRNEAGGHMINTASMGGLFVAPNLGGYCVTKYAVVGLSETLALELAADKSKVGVTVLCPGHVATKITSSTRNRASGLEPSLLRDAGVEETGEALAAIQPSSPREAGRIAVEAMVRGDLYATTNPQFFAFVKDRFDALERALGPPAAGQDAA